MAGYIGNKAVGLNVTTGDILGDVGVGGDIDVDGTANLDVVDIDGAVDMASTLQLDGAITLGVAGASNGFINSPSGIFVNIDSDNNQTDRFFDVRTNSADGSGALLFQVLETGAATIANGLTLTDGNLTVAAGHGIDFAAQTQSSATTTAELLDHYEEGTGAFSSVTNAAGNALSVTSNAFNYTKIGNFVQLEIRVQLASATTAEVRLNGPPFTISSTDTVIGEVISERIVFVASGTQIKLLAGDNNAFMYGVVTYRGV